MPIFTYQPKADRSFKVVLREIHPKINPNKITEELKHHNHTVRIIDDITKYDTKQPLFAIEFKPNNNNKDIYNIDKLLNTIIRPQCYRCQAFGHTKNYYNKILICIKCAGNHSVVSTPRQNR